MSEPIESLREKAATILTRLQTDPEFKAQVERNPESTLIQAGLPEDAILDFLEETQLVTDEVQGYLSGVAGGCTVTCKNTCANTNCGVTL